MEEKRPVTILIADDLALVREGLEALCRASAGYEVVGHCGNGEEALRFIEERRPDIAILDMHLPRLFVLEIVRQVRRAGLPTKLVLTSTRSDRKSVIEALRSGVHAIVLKRGPAKQLFDAFRQVLEGGVYVSPLIELEKIIAPPRARTSEDPMELLSAREHQVFTLMVEGLRAKEIAARLDLSPKTVDTYRASLMRKLDIHDLAGLVRFSVNRDLAGERGAARP